MSINVHKHGKYEHEHADGDLEHNHIMRALCGKAVCRGYQHHDIHPTRDE